MGVVGGESKLENKNLTTEAKGGEIRAEAGDLKEVEALRNLLAEAASELAAAKTLGIGPVAGFANGRSAIDSAIFGGKPLLPPIS